jgi:sugar phosphate isomerase/epimerase
MLLGYSTNSLGDIDPLAALPILRDLGYRSLAITLDRHCLDPFATDSETEADRWRTALAGHGMACVIETGSRHLLDPRVKHEPTLVSADAGGRAKRVDFLRRAIDVAARIGAGCVSLWSGTVRDSADEAATWERLVAGLRPVLDHAHGRGVVLGFEPEPGMFVDTLDRYRLLLERLDRPDHLRLTVDVGHLECMGERPAANVLEAWIERLVNVHVDDMLACRHDHLPLGTGDVDFRSLFAGLHGLDVAVGLHVELPRQSHRWFETARDSAAFLQRFLTEKRTA